MIDKNNSPRIAVFLSVLILLLPGFPSEKVVPSVWTSSPVTIDAWEQDWSEIPLTSEDSVGADFAFRNDGRHLYVLFIISDQAFLSTLDATGMTVYFNTAGKKKKDYGIRFYRKTATADEVILTLEKQGQELTEERKQEIRSKPSYRLYHYELIGKKKTAAMEMPREAEIEPPVFRYERKGEITVFEFRIPLSREIHPAGIGVAPGETFKIGFEWGGMTKEMQAARLARTVAATEKGVERETASEDHARGRESAGFSPSDPSSGLGKGVPKKYSFWADVKLASE